MSNEHANGADDEELAIHEYEVELVDEEDEHDETEGNETEDHDDTTTTGLGESTDISGYFDESQRTTTERTEDVDDDDDDDESGDDEDEEDGTERDATEKDETDKEATEKDETEKGVTEKDEGRDSAESESEHAANKEVPQLEGTDGNDHDDFEKTANHQEFAEAGEVHEDHDDRDAVEGDDEESEEEEGESEEDNGEEESSEESDDDDDDEDDEHENDHQAENKAGHDADAAGEKEQSDPVTPQSEYKESDGEEYYCPLETVEEVSGEEAPSELGDSDDDMPKYVPNISQRDERLSNYDEDEMPDDEFAAFEELSRDGPRMNDPVALGDMHEREIDEEAGFEQPPVQTPIVVEAASPPPAEPEIGHQMQQARQAEATNSAEPETAYFVADFDSKNDTISNDIEANEAATREAGVEKEANRYDQGHVRKAKQVEGDDDDGEKPDDEVRKFRRKVAVIACVIIAILIAVAIIVPVVIVSSRSSSSTKVETRPTYSPTVAPSTNTLAPSRIDAVIQYLSAVGISSKYELEKVGSPQHLAAIWLAEKDPDNLAIPSSLNRLLTSSGSADEFNARYIMVLLYYAMNGSTWKQHLNFLSSGNICDWKSNATEQDLTDSLGVSCSASLEVVGLDFSSNNVTGIMPTEIGNLTSLAFLSFDFNDVSGELPTTFEQLSNLTSLSFRHNNLQGSLPTWLDKLDGLKELGLSSNNFQGQLSQVIEGLTGLQKLYLDNNVLTGDLTSVGLLTNLEYLYLDNNAFSATLGDNTFVDLSELVELGISGIGLRGTLPTSFFQYLGLEVLDAHGNNITGTIPQALPPNPFLQLLALHQNSLQGSLPSSLQSLSALKLLELAENFLEGDIPEELSLMTSLEYLHLGLNNFSAGTIPTSFSQLTSLRELSLKGTSRTGTIPEAISALSSLIFLDLDENSLIGPIPSSLGALANLSFVLLSRNQLTGTVPTQLTSLSSLEIFLAFQNNITGSASPVCQITELQLCVMDCQGATPEVTCDCCSLCCEDGVTCIDSPLIANYDPQWESNNERSIYNFSGIIVIGAQEATTNQSVS